MSKGISEIASAALYIGVSIAAISTAISIGAPALEDMRDAEAVRNMQSFMSQLDATVQEVVAEGEGSTRTIDISMDRGRLEYDEETNSLIYELETNADIISPQTSRRSGNIVLASNANVDVYNVTEGGENAPSDYQGPDCYMMENQHVQACVKQVGSQNDLQPINSSDIMTYYRFKEEDRRLEGNMTVQLDEQFNSSYGSGYTVPETTGSFIGTGRLRARINSEYGYSYDIIFQLPSGADFLQIDVQNFA